MLRVLVALIPLLAFACNPGQEEVQSDEAPLSDKPASEPMLCEAFAGVCADRDHVAAHGCGGSHYAMDGKGWCPSAADVCCVLAAP